MSSEFPSRDSSSESKRPESPRERPARPGNRALRYVAWFFAVGLGLALAGLLTVIFALTMAYPNLPPLDDLTDYRPKMPMRIYTADHVLIGEFGEERRNLVRIQNIPEVMKNAVLAIEDDRFYTHSGVDYIGIARAAVQNITGGRMQGASTITQQVARNFFLSSEKTFKRKIYEILLAWKIEKTLNKDQILEIYMNQIYLGQRAFGFSSAAQIYFGKNLKDISIAEAAMLAGLPKAPSANNPVANPARARTRQQYILQRMHQLGYITSDEYEKAKNETVDVKTSSNAYSVHAEFVAEMARMLIYDQYKEEAYTRGLNVYTTITKGDQEAAYKAVRAGVLEYDRRHGYRGPEAYIEIPKSREEAADLIETELSHYPESDNILSAIVLEAAPKKVVAILASGEEITMTGSQLNFVASALGEKAGKNRQIKRGAIIRVMKDAKQNWVVTQMPLVESAFIAINAQDGAIKAMIGGFDFNHRKFNHVTQAWRQPGSSFKPFIFSAALDKKLAPASMINDSPISFSAGQTGGQAWEPKNYDSRYEGPMTMRRGLTKSKNMISIRILHHIGAAYGQEFITRFGFDSAKHPPYLTLALGAGSVTPLQMAVAYAVFANGGYKINPYLISHITNNEGKVISRANPDKAGNEELRVLDERNAFLMDSMLKDVTRYGTAAKARVLNRNDIGGKTGTTNDSHDAWFAGYQPTLVAIAWMGFDQPRNLGSRETGGGLALPIWIDYMRYALKDIPVSERPIPNGIIAANGDFYYAETPPGAIANNIGGSTNEEKEANGTGTSDQAAPPEQSSAEPPAED